MPLTPATILRSAAIAAVLMLAPRSTQASTIGWSNLVLSEGPQFLIADPAGVTPQIVDVGAYSGGSMTYEFLVHGNPGQWQTLLAQTFVGANQGIRFTTPNAYGLTVFGAFDAEFGVPTTFGSDLALAFVSDITLGRTDLFVNGVYQASVGMNLAIGGDAGLGGSLFPAAWFPSTAGFSASTSSPIYGAAVFGSALSAQQLASHYQTFQAIEQQALRQEQTEQAPTPVPEPATLLLFGTGAAMSALTRRRRRS